MSEFIFLKRLLVLIIFTSSCLQQSQVLFAVPFASNSDEREANDFQADEVPLLWLGWVILAIFKPRNSK